MPSASAPAADPDRTPPPVQRIGVFGRALGRAAVRGAGRAVVRTAGRLPGMVSTGPQADDDIAAAKSAARIRRVVLRSGPVLSLILEWPVDELDRRDATDHVSLTFRPVSGPSSGTALPPPIVLQPWTRPDEDQTDEPAQRPAEREQHTLWTGSGAIPAESGRWTLVARCGTTATDVLLDEPGRPVDFGPIHNRVVSENEQLVGIERGAGGEAVLGVETPQPAVTVRRVRSLRTPPEVEATVPTGWPGAEVAFELRQRGSRAVVACASQPAAASPVAADISDSHHRVLIDPDVLFGAGGSELASTIWDLWARSGAVQLRVGRRDTDLSSLRRAHSFGWTGANAAELRPYFTDSADFAVEIRPIREPSETAPDVVRASDPKLDLDRASGAL